MKNPSIHLTASDLYTLYSPKECERRVFLRAHDEPEKDKSPFQDLMEEFGLRHEKSHLEAFPAYENLSSGELDERIVSTLEVLRKGADVVYQGVLRAALPVTGDTIIGIPDFMIKDGDSYRIRDCKLARHADKARHPEILLQLELFGWLFEKSFGKPPTSLEAFLGDRSIAQFEYQGGMTALDTIKEIRSLSLRSDEPYTPVGWSKCLACGFRERCRDIAEANKDLSTVYGAEQNIAIALRERGTRTIDELLKNFDAEKLADLQRPHGSRMQRVGDTAARKMLDHAEAIKLNKEKILSKLSLPPGENMVMFDLEGVPPQFGDLEKIYLWGTQVFGKDKGKYMTGLAGFGPAGDKEGWEQFLQNSESIFRRYGDVPFVHWSDYEVSRVRKYVELYGDPKGVAARLQSNLLDLLRATKAAVVLPVYSYSLKVIEKFSGFKRTMDEFGGDWSIVSYIQAVETSDEEKRKSIMGKILKYNEEDLQAMWAVLNWLKEKFA
jgi:predicted RecB family nuclease